MSFNPRTRVGCDLLSSIKMKLATGFNPRTRVGCDNNQITGTPISIVSIHAPVWGATYVA